MEILLPIQKYLLSNSLYLTWAKHDLFNRSKPWYFPEKSMLAMLDNTIFFAKQNRHNSISGPAEWFYHQTIYTLADKLIFASLAQLAMHRTHTESN